MQYDVRGRPQAKNPQQRSLWHGMGVVLDIGHASLPEMAVYAMLMTAISSWGIKNLLKTFKGRTYHDFPQETLMNVADGRLQKSGSMHIQKLECCTIVTGTRSGSCPLQGGQYFGQLDCPGTVWILAKDLTVNEK